MHGKKNKARWRKYTQGNIAYTVFLINEKGTFSNNTIDASSLSTIEDSPIVANCILSFPLLDYYVQS